MKYQELLNNLEQRKDGMKNYLLLKFNEADWHAVQDAASDIRELEAQISVFKRLIDNEQDDQN